MCVCAGNVPALVSAHGLFLGSTARLLGHGSASVRDLLLTLQSSFHGNSHYGLIDNLEDWQQLSVTDGLCWATSGSDGSKI